MFKIIQADIKNYEEWLEPNSLDAIITDPPYGKKYLSIYEDLAKLGAYALKPGRPLLAMAGNCHYLEVLDLMRTHLDYYWTICNLTGANAPSSLMFQYKVTSTWKPIVWFNKGKYDNKGHYTQDVVKAVRSKNDRKLHKWGQNEAVFSNLIEWLTSPGDLVCDPCCGSGTTVRCCVRLNRDCIGADIDQNAVELSIKTTSNNKGILAY